MNNLPIVAKTEGRLQYIDAVGYQDNQIHVLGRIDENTAFHIIHDAQTGKIINEDSFIYRGRFPLFMCGCHTLACEGDCPTILDHELALAIHENRVKADNYDKNVVKFTEANLNYLK